MSFYCQLSQVISVLCVLYTRHKYSPCYKYLSCLFRAYIINRQTFIKTPKSSSDGYCTHKSRTVVLDREVNILWRKWGIMNLWRTTILWVLIGLGEAYLKEPCAGFDIFKVKYIIWWYGCRFASLSHLPVFLCKIRLLGNSESLYNRNRVFLISLFSESKSLKETFLISMLCQRPL